jgi:hypothetical protein
MSCSMAISAARESMPAAPPLMMMTSGRAQRGGGRRDGHGTMDEHAQFRHLDFSQAHFLDHSMTTTYSWRAMGSP